MIDKKINVLHLLSSFPMGGIERLLVEILRTNTTDNNIDYTIAIMNEDVNDNMSRELLASGYKVYFLNRKEGYKHPKYIFQLMEIIRKHDISIIHTHNPGGKTWSILCKLLNPNLKLVYTMHHSLVISEMSKLDILLHKKFIDNCIVLSDFMVDGCINNDINRITKIYNGIKLEKFLNSNQNLSLKNDVINLINVARFSYYIKGHDILIKALKICKDKGMKFKCTFVGTILQDDQDSYNLLVNTIKENNLEGDTKILINRNDVPELLRSSDLFLLSSRFEGLPLVILEAMAAGLPVISSNIAGSKELIKDGETGLLFENENINDLAEKLMYLYKNQEKMTYLSSNAQKYVQQFDISIMCNKYENLYKQLLSTRG